MHHRPRGLLRGSLQPRLSALLSRGCGGEAAAARLPPFPHSGPWQGPGPRAGQPAASHPPSPLSPRGRGNRPTRGLLRALLLISPYIWGRERRVGRHCCQWRLLTQIIIIKKNRYSWALTEYGNYYYCQSRLEIIILKARRVQLPRCFE